MIRTPHRKKQFINEDCQVIMCGAFDFVCFKDEARQVINNICVRKKILPVILYWNTMFMYIYNFDIWKQYRLHICVFFLEHTREMRSV